MFAGRWMSQGREVSADVVPAGGWMQGEPLGTPQVQDVLRAQPFMRHQGAPTGRVGEPWAGLHLRGEAGVSRRGPFGRAATWGGAGLGGGWPPRCASFLAFLGRAAGRRGRGGGSRAAGMQTPARGGGRRKAAVSAAARQTWPGGARDPLPYPPNPGSRGRGGPWGWRWRRHLRGPRVFPFVSRAQGQDRRRGAGG